MNIERMINILEVISNSGQGASTSEIHKLSKIPKPTCYRTIEHLLNHELLEDPNKVVPDPEDFNLVDADKKTLS